MCVGILVVGCVDVVVGVLVCWFVFGVWLCVLESVYG